jgi:AcrR family transcriptional regulator
MSYIAERRGEEKERRRAEILDAAELLYTKNGWDAVTVELVARNARLSRALVYVYFRDKEDLLFAIGERAMSVLRDRFTVAVAGPLSGMEKVEAIGRAHMGYAHEFPHYFDFCSRFQAHSISPAPGSNERGCMLAGDQTIGILVQSIDTGIRDGSMRANIGPPMLLAMTLWTFTHGVIQLTKAKGREFARRGIAISDFTDYAFDFLRNMARVVHSKC